MPPRGPLRDPGAGQPALAVRQLLANDRMMPMPSEARPRLVADRLVPCPWVIQSHESVARAHELMREHAIRHIPVLRDGDVVGIVSDRDLLKLRVADGPMPQHEKTWCTAIC